MAFCAIGCSGVRNTSPVRSAQELLLISTAADRAASALAAQIPANIVAYVDPSGFAAQDQAYGLAAIKDALLRRGIRLVSDPTRAQAIILPRTGMLSTDERNALLGIPALPVPMAPGIMIPALSIYSENNMKGAAKFAASVYDRKTGALIVSTSPAYGFSHQDDGVILFFITWRHNDLGVNFGTYPPQISPPEGEK